MSGLRDASSTARPSGCAAPRTGRSPRSAPTSSPSPARRCSTRPARILVPPLVNGHTHAAMTLFRGSGGDLPLMPWLEERIWPVEAKLEPEDVYWGTRLACLEMIRSGTTRFWDMYWQPEATARAVADAGLRATIGAPLFDKGRDAEGDAGDGAREPRAAGRARRPGHRRARPALDLHGQRGVARLPRRALGRARDAPVQIHLSETEPEVERLPRRARPAPGRLPRRPRPARASAPCSPTASGSTTTSSS